VGKKTYFCFVLLSIFIFTNNYQLFGSQEDSLRIEKFYQNLYNYKFLSADSILKDMSDQKISSQITGILQISLSWWQIISGENTQDKIDSLFKRIDSNIALIEYKTQKSELSQDEILQLIVLYSYKSRLHNYQNNRLASFSAFKQSFNYFEKLIPFDSGNCDMYNFIAGMYYALGGHLHQQFSPVFILGLNRNYADTAKGYKLLKLCTLSQNKQIRTESIYFLMKLYFEAQDDPEVASTYSGQLVDQFPDNLVFRFNYVLMLYTLGKYNAAESAYQKLLKRSQMNLQLTTRQKQHFEEEYTKLKH